MFIENLLNRLFCEFFYESRNFHQSENIQFCFRLIFYFPLGEHVYTVHKLHLLYGSTHLSNDFKYLLHIFNRKGYEKELKNKILYVLLE